MTNQINIIGFTNVPRLFFGTGCLNEFTSDILRLKYKRVFILTIPQLINAIQPVTDRFEQEGIDYVLHDRLSAEPTFEDLRLLLDEARHFGADSIAGIGGGSVLDCAKMMAAMLDRTEDPVDYAGIGLLPGRNIFLACLPTTAGTGSEVSPNAIFLDETNHAKKGVISPYLVPDATYIDPVFTLGLPPSITASTGIDAFTHCIEAYVNNFAHPITDLLAIEGMKLIIGNLTTAVNEPDNLNARSALALGSMYGGLCLGPVNTAAVHALAYPLGSRFKIAHGLSNALMLPHVIEFNTEAAPEKYARVAQLFNDAETTRQTDLTSSLAEMLKKWVASCGLPTTLKEVGIYEADLSLLSTEALNVQRLLKNNVRSINLEQAREIYMKAL